LDNYNRIINGNLRNDFIFVHISLFNIIIRIHLEIHYDSLNKICFYWRNQFEREFAIYNILWPVEYFLFLWSRIQSECSNYECLLRTAIIHCISLLLATARKTSALIVRRKCLCPIYVKYAQLENILDH